MSIRTDLAIEQIEMHSDRCKSLENAVKKKTQTQNGIIIVSVEISSPEAATLLGKPCGKYITLHMPSFENVPDNLFEQAAIVSNQILEVIPQNINGALVVGLGNCDITPDALGPKTISYIFATRHIDDQLKQSIGMGKIAAVSAIATGVLGQTGIESAEIIASVVDKIKPSMVIVVDALASKSVDRLGKTIQISNVGISPGSGVQNKRCEISEKTLSVPVIAIGVPMVVDMTTIAEDMFGKQSDDTDIAKDGRTMMVTPREIDVVIEHAAKIIAMAINKALQPSLSMQEIASLVG